MRVALPSKGRLREDCLSLLKHAGFALGSGARATVGDIEMIEMRPRDAAAALAVGQLDAAFLSTDIVAEHDLRELPAVGLGFARCDLVLASREDDGRRTAADLAGSVIATHLPRTAERYFSERGIDARVLPMGGALEGVCVAGIADGIMDLRQSGSSLLMNGLRVLDVLENCEALLVRRDATVLEDLVVRVEAVLSARRQRYLMLHLPPDRIEELRGIFSGLAAPTILPLAGRDDLVAVHLVVPAAGMWSRLAQLRTIGATGIVAIEPEAMLL
ncbi:MAG TPA: ATP phosphoribosyltransferase [Mycobacteriales bacterium]|nr:ATP phosphoribosyltransferase [Mycobacteriales bacterium]